MLSGAGQGEGSGMKNTPLLSVARVEGASGPQRVQTRVGLMGSETRRPEPHSLLPTTGASSLPYLWASWARAAGLLSPQALPVGRQEL